MPTSNRKTTKEERFEATKRRWEEAETGTGGLRKVRLSDFEDLPGARKCELLTEATILTCDGLEMVVVMTIEDYFSRMPPTVNPLKQPMMLRHEGRLFREVV